MNTTFKVFKYELNDVVRGRWALGYALFFLLATEALLRFGGDGSRALLSIANIVLFVVPLVSAVFGTIYLYDAREFTQLLLAQPVHRKQLFAGLYLGLATPLAAAFVLGTTLPFAARRLAGADLATFLTLLGAGTLLTFVFAAIAFLIAIRFEEKVKGLASAILLWLGLTVVYDGFVMILAAAFADFPLEKPMIGAMLLNPVDLARVLLLMRFDVSALMGYTGAVFEQFFGGLAGLLIAGSALAAWLALPLMAGMRSFARKDF